MNQKMGTVVKPTGSSKFRPSGKSRQIAELLRRQIVTGVLPPGHRLPTRIELTTQFQTSSVTVQRALERLARDGAIQARGKLGTFVSNTPPHLTRYAIVFPGRPPHSRDSEGVPMFWTTLANQAAVVGQELGREIAVHFLPADQMDQPVAQSLIRQVRTHRLAGIIFGGPPAIYSGSPLLDEEPLMPRVAVMGGPDSRYPQVGSIRLAGEQLPEKAMEYLAHKGCRRVAVVANWGQGLGGFSAAAARRGMELPGHWMQYVSFLSPGAARNLLHLMFYRADDRPDGLIIADDNLVQAASAGLIDAGVRVPQDLHVVAHCNFPAPTSSVLPLVYLGYDSHALVRSAVDAIDQARAGQLMGLITIPAVFQDELAQNEAPVA